MKKILIIGKNYGSRKNIEYVVNREDYDFAIHVGNHNETNDFMARYFHIFQNMQLDKTDQKSSKNFEFYNYSFHIESKNIFESLKENEENKFLLEKIKKIKKDFFIFSQGSVATIEKIENTFIINPGSLEKNGWNDFTSSYVMIFIKENYVSISIKKF